MTDSSSTRGQGLTRIDPHRPEQLREWAKKFDVTEQQIVDAVHAVGDKAADVEMYLKGSHSTTDSELMASKGARR